MQSAKFMTPVQDTVRLIVRRGLSPAYYGFLQVFAKANGFEVILDRRVGDRRRRFDRFSKERRADDRRTQEPPTWDEGDFLLDTSQKHPDPSGLKIG